MNRIILLASALAVCFALTRPWRYPLPARPGKPAAPGPVSPSASGPPPGVAQPAPPPRAPEVADASATPQSWPAPESAPWSETGYSLVAGRAPEVLGFRHGDQVLFAFRSQLRPVPCGPGSGVADCVRLPNLQLVKVTPALEAQLPFIALLRARAGGNSAHAPAKRR